MAEPSASSVVRYVSSRRRSVASSSLVASATRRSRSSCCCAAREELAAVAERALGGVDQVAGLHRLQDEVVGAVGEALHRRLHVADAGEHEHGGVGVDGARLLQELEPVHHRHAHVGHREGRVHGRRTRRGPRGRWWRARTGIRWRGRSRGASRGRRGRRRRSGRVLPRARCSCRVRSPPARRAPSPDGGGRRSSCPPASPRRGPRRPRGRARPAVPTSSGMAAMPRLAATCRPWLNDVPDRISRMRSA